MLPVALVLTAQQAYAAHVLAAVNCFQPLYADYNSFFRCVGLIHDWLDIALVIADTLTVA